MIQASLASAVEAAKREVTSQPGSGGVVCVCGSLHAVSEALHALQFER